jgi:RsiW-degrading membrane proteinase PrsW (M82 family)
MIVYLTIMLCALVLGLMVYRYDLHDREPVVLLLLVFVIGFYGMRGAGHLEDAIFRALDDGVPSIGLLAVVAGAVEESLKLLLVLAVALTFRTHFNEPLDGLVYGAFAGLGMALEESFHYLSFTELGPSTTGQEIVRLLAHHLMGGIVGFGVGMARFRVRRWPLGLAGCFLASFSLHVLWDVVAGLQLERLTTTGYHQAAAIALMMAAVILFGFLVTIGGNWSRERFAPGDERTRWAWPFTMLVGRRRAT